MINILVLALALATQPDSLLSYGIAYGQAGDHEASENILSKVKETSVSNPEVYSFWRLMNNFRMNRQAEAKRWSARLENSFTQDLPTRYAILSMLMREEMKSWKKNDLSDLARDMQNVQDRLGVARGGPATQKIQKDIVSRLDKMIADLEKSPPKGDNSPNDKDKDQPRWRQLPKPGEQQPKQEGKQQAQGQSQQPLPDSKIVNNNGKGTIDQTKLRKFGPAWGRLPERERARAIQEMTRNMSPRHRQAVEEYFRRLAETPINRKQ